MESLIHLPTLAAVAAFASAEQTRYYLNGVSVTLDASGATYVATDGHRLAVRRVDHPHGTPNTLLGTWIVPFASCRAIKLPKRKASAPEFAYGTLTQSGGRLTLLHDGSGHTFQPIDGSFPDWRRILPQTVSGTMSASINGHYLASVDDFGAALQIGLKTCHWNAEGPSVFTFSQDEKAFCLVMPIRNGTGAWTVPAWLNAPTTDAAPDAAPAPVAEPLAA